MHTPLVCQRFSCPPTRHCDKIWGGPWRMETWITFPHPLQSPAVPNDWITPRSETVAITVAMSLPRLVIGQGGSYTRSALWAGQRRVRSHARDRNVRRKTGHHYILGVSREVGPPVGGNGKPSCSMLYPHLGPDQVCFPYSEQIETGRTSLEPTTCWAVTSPVTPVPPCAMR
jgi:hypothetical protein